MSFWVQNEVCKDFGKGESSWKIRGIRLLSLKFLLLKLIFRKKNRKAQTVPAFT